MKIFGLLLIAVVMFSACNYDVTKTQEKTGGPGTQGTNLTFDTVLKGALQNNCVDCHGRFVSYEAVAAVRLEMIGRVESGNMPKGRAMPAADRAMLLEWLKAGAPRDAQSPAPTDPGTNPQPCKAEPPTSSPTPELTFSNVLQTALRPNCVACHAGFATYAKVFARRKAILAQVESRSMPPRLEMPDEARALLLEWLRAGAPEGAGDGLNRRDHPEDERCKPGHPSEEEKENE